MHTLHSWIEISRAAFAHNINTLNSIIAPAHIMAVIKAHAYGHGLQEIATLAQEHPQVTWLCTASISEAVALRTSGITKPLLVLAYHDAPYTAALEHDIALTLTDMAQLTELEQVTRHYRQPLKVHLKIDTGMSRLGLTYTQATQLLTTYHNPLITIQGLCTHLYNKDHDELISTHEQLERFNKVLTQDAPSIHTPFITHALSSGALDSASQFPYTNARIGTHLYGFQSSSTSHQRLLKKYPATTLKPVLTWKTRIISIKTIQPGTCVGYGCTFKATGQMNLAILPIGYSDGYPRQLSHKSMVLVHNHLVPVIGTISMNLLIIDITHVPQARLYDEVTLIGDYPGITAQDLADKLGTIPIEITTRLNPLIKRIIV